MGSTKLLPFHLPGLGFFIFFMLKRPLEPHCKSSYCECEYPSHLFLEISYHHCSESFTLYFYSLCTFSLINRNCVLLYLCVYGCIYDIFLLYCWISDTSMYIYLLYLCSHFMPKIISMRNAKKYFWVLFSTSTFLECNFHIQSPFGAHSSSLEISN
jgi:hypothetical protein